MTGTGVTHLAYRIVAGSNPVAPRTDDDGDMPLERFDLDDDEVTVLNHVMHALTERTDFEQLVPDAADRQAMHNLLAALEREDRAVFSDAYDHCVEQARRRLLPHK